MPAAETKAGGKAGPTLAAINNYRQAVYAAGDGTGPTEPSVVVLAEAWKTHDGNWKRDLSRYTKRRDSARAIANRELQRKATEAQAVVNRAAQIVATPLAGIDFDRLKAELIELWSTAPSVVTNQPAITMLGKLADVATLGALADVLQAHARLIFPALRSHANDLAMAAQVELQQAHEFLFQTTSPELGEKLHSIALEIGTLENTITANDRLLGIDAKIERATDVCNCLARGERADSRGIEITLPGWTQEATRKAETPALYRAAKHLLDELHVKARGKDQAAQSSERCREEIALLRTKMDATREECLVPKNMAWGE
jgi:hypothetical protein